MTPRTNIEVWCGLKRDSDTVQPYVGPSVLPAGERCGMVGFTGTMGRQSLRRFTRAVYEVASRPDIRLVYVWLANVPCGLVDELPAAIAELNAARDCAALVAYCDGQCFGLGAVLAIECDIVFAAPTAMIGHLACHTREGNPAPEATDELLDTLTAHRPGLAATFDALANCALNSEQLEAMGLVSSLKNSFNELAAIGG